MQTEPSFASEPPPSSCRDSDSVERRARRSFGVALLHAMKSLGQLVSHGASDRSVDAALIEESVTRVQLLLGALEKLRRVEVIEME